MKVLFNLDMRLGDEIMCLPAIQGLKEANPKAEITVRTNYPEIFDNNPFINEVIRVQNSDEHRKFEEETDYPQLNRSFDRLVDLKWKHERGKNRIKVLCDFVDAELSTSEPKIFLSKKEKENFLVPELKIKGLKVAVCAEAKWRSRKWPAKKFRKICRFLKAEKSATLFELGTTTYLCEGINLVGKTGIRDLAIILSQCDLFLGNDSGLMHLALAVGTPVIAIFGPILPETRVILPNEAFRPVQADLDCLGCYTTPLDSKRKFIMGSPDACPRFVRKNLCMTSLSEKKVIAGIGKILP